MAVTVKTRERKRPIFVTRATVSPPLAESVPTLDPVPMAPDALPPELLPTRPGTPAVDAFYTHPAPVPEVVVPDEQATPEAANAELPTYLGPVEAAAARVRALENAPLPTYSRKRAALAGGLYGLSKGLATGNIGAGIGAGIAGTVGGAVRPQRIAYLQRQDEIAEEQERFKREVGRATAIGTLESQAALAKQRRDKAQHDELTAARAAKDKRIARLMQQLSPARLDKYDPTDKSHAASQQILKEATELGIADQLVPFTKPEGAPQHIKVLGVTYVWNNKTREYEKARGIPEEPMVEIEGPQGKGYIGLPQWYQGDLNRQARDYSTQQTDQRRAEDEYRKEQEKRDQQRKEAADIISDLEESRQDYYDLKFRTEQSAKAEQSASPAGKATAAEARETWEYHRDKALSKAKALMKKLGGYGHLYETGLGSDGVPYVKERVEAGAPPAVPVYGPTRQAPAPLLPTRQGSKRYDVSRYLQ
jgi:hypothetical protein